MISPEEFVRTLENIDGTLQSYDNLLQGQDLQNFKSLLRNLKNALQEEKDRNSTLRLGIIGSVKAGKSTFLNALLFDGEEILPKASTPMTASLTKLGYAKEQFIRFVFYSNEDWEQIDKINEKVQKRIKQAVARKQEEEEKQARQDPYYMPRRIQEQDIIASLELTDAEKACMELVSHAVKNNLDLLSLLGQENRREASDLSEVAKLMREYIGSDGKYSPIVKYVEMGLDNATLHDLEIVDTPGLNDPVASRSNETYNFMCQCDAVFLLSRASQFLTNDDQELLRRTLLDNGIKQVTVIATQLDLGAQNEVGKTDSYKEALRRSLANIKRTAEKAGITEKPIPISAMLEIVARKKEKSLSLSPEEFHIEKNIARFKRDAPQTPEELRKLSYMTFVRKEVEKYRQNKERIILEHQEARARQSRRNFLEIMDSLIKGVETDRRILEENDVASLKKIQAGLTDIIANVKLPISNVFSGLSTEVGHNFADLKQRILANAKNYEGIDVASKSHIVERPHTTGAWFWKKTHYTVVKVTTYIAELADSLQLLRNYVAKAEEDINDTIKELVNKNALREKLTAIILPVFRKYEIANANLALNEDMIILPVNSLVEEFTIPQWHFDNSPYNSELQKNFGAQIENEDIAKFKAAFELQLQRLCQDMRQTLDKNRDQIMDRLAQASVNFANDISQRLDQQLVKIGEQMKDREEGLKKYAECRQTLENCKKMMVQ